MAISLTRITERASKSSETLNELCKHGIIQQIFQLFNSNGGTTLSLPVYKVWYFFLIMSWDSTEDNK